MKKILSTVVLVLLVFSSNPGWVLAMDQILPPLEKEKEKTEIVLENLIDRVDATLEKADRRIVDTEQSEKIQEKQEEIQELLHEVRVSLENADSKNEVKEIMEETKDIIVLKTSAALTPTDDITEDPSFQKLSSVEKIQAEETLLSSLDSGEKNTIMIRSRSADNLIREKLTKYDETLVVDFQFEEDGYKIYEVIVSKESLLSEELLENLDAGEIPESILGIEIIRPELFQIGTLDLIGEDRMRLWGIEKYTTPLYLESLKQRSSLLTRKVRVGIIDTGIESTHKDLLGQVNASLGYDFVNEDADPTDDQGHGTHVAGTIAGNINGTGVFGVNPYVELVALKICDNKGFCPSYSVLKALSYAKEHNFDVLNMSLGARGNPETSPICSAVKDITAGGTIVVAAAGNSNVDTSTFVPGGCRAAITVAAVDESGKRAAFSNYGSKVDVAAPGVGIYSSYIGGGHKSLNGTSMATPHIVGLVSIIRTYRRDISTDGVKGLLQTYRSPVISDTNKPVAAGVDVSRLIAALSGLQGVPDSDKKIETLLRKEDKQGEITEKTNTGMNPDSGEKQKTSIGSPEDSIAIIDESIGLEIQKDAKMEINSLGELQRDAVEINNADEAVQSSSLLDPELIAPEVFTSEGVEVNNADEPIDFSQIDTSTGLMSTGDPKKLYGQEKTTIELSERDVPEGYTLINTDTDEEYDVILGSQEDPLLEESEDTAIQNTYTCSIYAGYTCSFNLPAASIRQYNMSNTSIASVSAGNSSFTITGRSPGSTTLYVNYAGRTIATIYITVQRKLVPIGANYGTNTLDPGRNTYLSIRSGNGGYSVSSSNPSIVSVSGYDTNWTLTANNPGTATITYRDSAGYYGTVNMTVTAPPRNLSVSVGQTTIQKGKSTALTITDGNGGYSVSSSNPSIVSVSGNNTSWTLSAINPGTASISIRDSRGRVASITLTVTQVTPIRTLWFNYNPNLHHIGWVSTININDGNGGYNVTSSNPSILAVSGSNTSWSLSAKSPGSVIITIQDQRGMIARVPYTVLRQVSGNLSNISPIVGQSAIFTITDGNGGYTLTSSNPSVATVRQTTTGTDTSYTITALSVGETILTIRDRLGSSGWIKMTVRPGSKSLTLDKSTLTVEVGSDAYFQVTSGNGGYSHSMSNGNVGWYYVNSAIPSYRVRGLTPGTTILQIRDSVGKVVQVRVEVVAKIVEPQFQNVSYTQVSEGLWDIRFDISGGGYKEIGVEQNGESTPLSLESDNSYYVQLYNTVCILGTSACDFTGKIYLISSTGKKIYTFPKTLAYFSPDTALNYIANADEEIGSGVEINNAVTDSLKWGVSQVKGAVKKVDITKNLRNWDNLTALQQEEFYEGVRDTLSLNNLHAIAVNIGAGVAIDKVATIIGKALIAKYGKKVAIKLGAKMVPYLGWALLGYSIGTAGAENVEYMTLCANENLSITKDSKGPLYYCGKLAVNGMFIGAGLGVSRVHSVGVYAKLKKVVWSKVPKPDMSKVKNQTLRNIIEQNLYKDGSSYGNGSLADAIRFEKATGLQVEGKWHTKSGEDNRNALIKVYDFLNQDEKRIVETLYTDISNALNGN